MTIEIDPEKLQRELESMRDMIDGDPIVRAHFDTNGDGEVDGEEWEAVRQRVDSNELVKREASHALRRIRRSIDLYVVSTLSLSVMAFVLIALFGSLAGSKERWLFGMAVYGCVSAGLMGVARTRILRRSHDATRWARWAIVVAMPGGALMAYMGFMLLYFAGASIVEGAPIDFVAAVAIAIALVGTGGYALNGLALARLFRADLDELLWETESERSVVNESLKLLE